VMGGEISVESTPGMGSTFKVTAWFAKQSNGQKRAPLPKLDMNGTKRLIVDDHATSGEKTNPASLQRHILLAEDNEVNQEVARHRVETLGCTVDVVETGREVLDVLSKCRYDLILMDCQMPEMDGYTATALIRASEKEDASKSTHIPIIALTAHAMEGDRARCIAAGMDDYLGKPFTQAQLRSILERWLPERFAPSVADAEEVSTTGASVIGQTEHGEAHTDNVSPNAVHSEEDHIDRAVWDELRSLTAGGTNDLLHDILRTYLNTSPDLMQSLREAVAKADAVAICELAHSLKSSNGNIGALKMAASCKELELMARAHSIASAPQLLAQIEAEYRPVTEILRAEVQGEVCRAGDDNG